MRFLDDHIDCRRSSLLLGKVQLDGDSEFALRLNGHVRSSHGPPVYNQSRTFLGSVVLGTSLAQWII